MSLTFLPRKVKGVGKTHASTNQLPDPSISSGLVPPSEDASGTAPSHFKLPEPGQTEASEPRLPDELLLICLTLAISDYALSKDDMLRGTIELQSDNYLPLSYLFARAGIPFTAEIERSASHMLKDTGQFQVRMLLGAPRWPLWADKERVGAYEIRRVTPVPDHIKEYWQQRTVYVEGIPSNHKTPGEAALYAISLLPTSKNHHFRIQAVHFPSHFRDPSDIKPRFKGFALVVLDDIEDAISLTTSYPWHVGESTIRTLAKGEWDRMNEEYKRRRDDIIRRITSSQEAHASQDSIHEEQDVTMHDDRLKHNSHKIKAQDDDGPSVTYRSTARVSYPPNCLVFARRLDPSTNKTALRALFVGTLSGTEKEQIDYIDFNKGMDTCYVRLASPLIANKLVAAFSSDARDENHSTWQSTPFLELVVGKPEELYWERVPEKIRCAAVRRTQEH